MIYRQRLTPIGWVGSLIAIALPIIAGFIAKDALWGSPYSRTDPIIPLILFAVSPAGWVMVAVGREYYDATEEAKKEKEEALRNHSAVVPLSDEFFGDPMKVRKKNQDNP